MRVLVNGNHNKKSVKLSVQVITDHVWCAEVLRINLWIFL